jgi:hypothetical protein
MAKPELEFFDSQTLAWRTMDGDRHVSERVLAQDPATGMLTRLVRWEPGHTTAAVGPVAHDYFEEVLILSGWMRDLRLDQRFGPAYYACRPPGMVHGPWETDAGCVMLETRYEAAPAR